MDDINNEGIRNLIVGIVKQALFDYERALRVLYRKPLKTELDKVDTRVNNCTKAIHTINEVKRYFDSAEYAEICELDGKKMLAMVEKNIREEYMKKNE